MAVWASYRRNLARRLCPNRLHPSAAMSDPSRSAVPRSEDGAPRARSPRRVRPIVHAALLGTLVWLVSGPATRSASLPAASAAKRVTQDVFLDLPAFQPFANRDGLTTIRPELLLSRWTMSPATTFPSSLFITGYTPRPMSPGARSPFSKHSTPTSGPATSGRGHSHRRQAPPTERPAVQALGTPFPPKTGSGAVPNRPRPLLDAPRPAARPPALPAAPRPAGCCRLPIFRVFSSCLWYKI